MTDEKRVCVGVDADGNELYVGDRVKVINHPLINERIVGKTRTIHSASLRYPVPEHLLAAFGERGWFEVVTEGGSHHGLHARAVWKKESA